MAPKDVGYKTYLVADANLTGELTVHIRNHILVVEDDMIQAMDFEIAPQDCGYDVVGNAATSESAFLLIAEVPPDFAIIDYNLAQRTSIPVAVKL